MAFAGNLGLRVMGNLWAKAAICAPSLCAGAAVQAFIRGLKRMAAR